MNTSPDDCLDVIVIGAGQAGLAIGWHLRQQDARFLILDSAPEIGHSWRTRWDSLRLFPKPADSVLARRMRARGDLVIGSPVKALLRAGVRLRPRVVSASEDGVTYADGTTSPAATVIWATGFRNDYG